MSKVGVPRSSRGRKHIPTGDVAFLFTDIEGSTVRWERHPEAMRNALARHNQLLHAAVESSGGFVFKTVGDAFCAAFEDPPAAIDAATRAQQMLHAEDFSAVGGVRVRMAVHLGIADERDGDYFGPTVNRVARILSIGHGGQVLISGAVADAVGTRAITGGSLRDLGMHRLKDLTEAEHVYQIDIDGLASQFPSLNSLDLTPHNLPAQATSFVGRDVDVREAMHLLDQTRALTLTGAGGVGKTRLALQVAADSQVRFPDGVWLVELAPLADPTLVTGTVARVVGARRGRAGTEVDAVIARLRNRRCLLLLDNCEHVLDAVAPLADAVIRNCKHVRIIATSREPLRIDGETTMRVQSLDVPQRDVDPASALSSGAVQLFTDRAKAADPSFTLGAHNATGVIGVCRRLDGIPLAIELAAARVATLGVDQLLSALDDRFHLLTGGSRAALPRQQTMRALIDWSHDLLGEQERTVFSRLSVFAGGWTAEAADAVCGPSGGGALDHLLALAAKSLVVTTGNGAKRYAFLETTRAYAQEKLAASGDSDTVARRHAEFILALAERMTTSLPRGHIGLQEALAIEIDNLRGALSWTIDRGADPLLGARIALVVHLWWFTRGHVVEAVRWVTSALAKVEGADDRLEAQLWHALASITVGKQSAEAARNAQRLAQKIGDELLVLRSQYREGAALCVMGRRDEARALLEPLRDRFDALGDDVGAAACSTVLSMIALERGQDADVAEAYVRDALRRYRSVGDARNVATSLGNLGSVEEYRGNAEGTRRFAEEALVGFRAVGDVGGASGALCHIARCRLTTEAPDAARPAVHDALRAAKEAQHPIWTAFSIKIAAQLALLAKNPSLAARLWGYVSEWQRESASFVSEGLIGRDVRPLDQQLADAFSKDERVALCAEGAGWTEDQALQEALRV